MSDLFMDMQCRRQKLQNAADSGSNSSFNVSACDSNDVNQAEDEISNMLSLKLKKPKHWNWELTTSRSCANIALPRILLYDHTGELLVDVNSQEEKIYKPTTRTKRKHKNQAATANLEHSIRQALKEEFDSLQIQEATPSLQSQSPATSTPQQTRNTSPLASSSCIDFYTNDLSDYKSYGQRSNSLKSVRFKDDDNKSSTNSFPINGLPTPPPSSGTTPTTGTSSSSGPREKRRYRRTHSSGRSSTNSQSILERFSFNKGRFSSPENVEETEVYQPPRYFLATSKAGTLVVKEESFSRYRRRRRKPKNSSSEYLLNENTTQSLKALETVSKPYLGAEMKSSSQAGSLQNVASLRRRRKNRPIRRFRSDGNVLLQREFSSSEEDAYDIDEAQSDHVALRSRHNKYDNLKRHLKGDLVKIHPDNGVFPYGSPTER